MALIGYARVSTEDQITDRQLDELRAAGCAEVFKEHASGGNRDRPVLAQALARVRAGDTLVVVSLDRLARSLSHLLVVIEGLQTRGAFFRSLRDPVDTASPQGLFTLQVLGAAAELESGNARGAACALLLLAVNAPAPLDCAAAIRSLSASCPRRGGPGTSAS
jgi:DNA invertase Pin-like site-specific DNA recombinase